MKLGYSIIASNLLELKDDISKLNFVDFLHVDIMDGNFVKNISVGHSIIEDIKKYYLNIFIDVHLMTQDPTLNLDKLKDVKRIFIHIESIKKDNFKIEEIISFSKKNNIELGLAISPKTNISDLFTYLTEIKNVMIMSVEPGKCGQKFIPKSIERIDVIKARFPDVKIQVDGGINSSNIKLLYNHNVDSIIIGSALKKESIEINKIINELFYSKMTSNVL